MVGFEINLEIQRSNGEYCTERVFVPACQTDRERAVCTALDIIEAAYPGLRYRAWHSAEYTRLDVRKLVCCGWARPAYWVGWN